MNKSKNILKYAFGGEETGDPVDPNKPIERLTAKQIAAKYKGNQYVKGRENWGQSLDATLPGTKTKVRDAINNAAKASGLKDPTLLYSSAMEEGLGYRLNKPNDVSEAYTMAAGWEVNPTTKRKEASIDPNAYPVDGFYNYGLDTFGDQYQGLAKKGYLPEGFDKKFKTYSALNEKKQKVNTAAFASDEDALTAKAAMLRATQDELTNFTKKNKYNLTPEQQEFFTLAGYNGGTGNMQKMIKSYADKGYLKDNKFLDASFKPESYGDIYTNVQRRLQNRNVLKTEGFFATGGEVTDETTTQKKGMNPGVMDFLGQLPGLANTAIDLIENDPRAYSRQPTLNADTMRQMVTPYGLGGDTGNDDEMMAQLQAMADEQGISVEELIQMLQEQGGGDEAEEEDNPDEEGMEEYRYGGIHINPKNKGKFNALKARTGKSTEELTHSKNPLTRKRAIFAQNAAKWKHPLGGSANAKPIEVEDNEILQTPDGTMQQMKGNTHEEGGIPVEVPKGTKIYSDRLKLDGKTMAERKVKREKSLKVFERALIKKPGDKILQNSYQRTLETTQQEEAMDMALQNFLNTMFNATGEVPEMGYGGNVDQYAYGSPGIGKPVPNFKIDYQKLLDQFGVSDIGEIPGFKDFMAKRKAGMTGKFEQPTEFSATYSDEDQFKDKAAKEEEQPAMLGSGLTAGDYVGLGGNILAGLGPLITTVRNAKGAKPNVNRYLGFGNEALQGNAEQQTIAEQLKNEQTTDIETDANTARLRNRNSTQSVNTLRALDAITDTGRDKAKQNANDSFTKTMMNLMTQRGQLENIQDRMEMAGEERRDIEDKADRDNYSTNMAENLANLGVNIQGIGRNLNTSYQNKVDAQLISQLSQYGLGFDEDGNLISTKKK